MAQRRRVDVQFPLGGLNRRGAYRQQAPYTSTDLLNVRPRGTSEGRERGGSRPGLVESHVDDLPGEIRFLSPMVLALGDDFMAWSDTFGGTEMGDAWTSEGGLPNILPNALASIDYSTSTGGAVADLLPIDTSQAYAVELFITPWNGSFHGSYSLYFRLHDTNPSIAGNAVIVRLTMDDDTGGWSGYIRNVVNGVPTDYALPSGTLFSSRPGWLTATVTGDTVKVYWNGNLLKTQAVAAYAGTRVGFGLECVNEGGLALANVFRTQFYTTATAPVLRSMLVASGDGEIWNETSYGRMTEVSTLLSVRDDTHLTATQSGQDLYIADYGDVRANGTDGVVSGATLDAATYPDWSTLGISAYDDVVVITNVGGATVAGTYEIQSVAAGAITLTASPGDGTCAYRIERAPKVYDPSAGTVVKMIASTGQVPTGNPLIARYIDRIVLAGAEIAPHVWYMSRKGSPLDWDYSQTDSERAVAGTSSEAGTPGGPITALIPHSDDYLIIAERNEIWRLRGDPAFGGALDSLSSTIGVIGPDAWCMGPAGELIFMSLDGLYALAPGGNSFPISLSREILPREFLNIDPNIQEVLLEYDVHGRGVHIYLTAIEPNSRLHWWFDWERKTFWPMSLDSGHEPTATCQSQATAIEESGVILGGRDGQLRRPSDLAACDTGESFTSYVVIGPIALNADGFLGRIMAIDAIMASTSSDVTWELFDALTFEALTSASSSDTGTWVAGLNATIHPACNGQAFALKITGTEDTHWSMENVIADVRSGGRRRIT